VARKAWHVRYAGRFRDNRIDVSVLGDLTDEDLKELGVVLGDRRNDLAIASLTRPQAQCQSRLLASFAPSDSAASLAHAICG
jgi:hypothetical protein